MKIIQITPSYKPAYIYGGPTMSVAKLCEALVKFNGNSKTEKIDLEVLTTTANGLGELNVEPDKQVSIDGVPVTYFKRITKDHTHFSPALLLGLRRKIKEHKAQERKTENDQQKTINELIIHIHSWWNLATIFSCFVAKIYHIPVVLSPRGMLTNYTQNNRNSFFKSALHFLIGKSLLKYVYIIASSEKEKLDVLEITKPKNITIIPNLVQLPSPINHLPLNEKQTTINDQRKTNNDQRSTINEKRKTKNDQPFNLLFLSRIEEKKGLDILFDALANSNINWSLSIGGKGEDEYVKSLKAKAESLNLNTRINWLGQINNQDKFNLLANHDVLVLTSHNENFANVVIESLSVGTPVLLSNQVGLSSYIEDNQLGFITSLDPHQISTKLNEAYLNFDKRNRIRLDAPSIIARDFNENELTKKYLDFYTHILTLD